MTALERLREEVSRMEELLSRVANDTGCDLYGAKRHFDRVNAALKAVEDEQRWIPFEGPDIGEAMYRDVLVITEDGSLQIATYVDPGGFLGLNELFSDIVTHWRPLPKGPGEETK